MLLCTSARLPTQPAQYLLRLSHSDQVLARPQHSEQVLAQPTTLGKTLFSTSPPKLIEVKINCVSPPHPH